MKRFLLIALSALTLLTSAPALASDHLANATAARDSNPGGPSGNPVANNPSGTSAGQAQPGTVPGEGDPNSEVQPPDGSGIGTPAVDLGCVFGRTDGAAQPADTTCGDAP
jgi:hypothetical protein